MFRFYQSDCFTEDMDDSSHRENGRQKPTQSQWLMQHQPSMKQIMAIMAERDAAIQERNLAISEKKTAITERDMAILQRDSAIAERNNAIIERDNAISTLYRENAMNNNSMQQCAPECQIDRGVKNLHIPQQHTHHQTHMVESQHEFRHMHLADAVTISSIGPNPAKPRRVKRAKEAKPVTTARKPPKSSKRVKQEAEDLNKAIVVVSQEWKSGHNTAGSASDDPNRSVGSSKQNWKDQDLGLNQVPFDETTMPVPVCSCTGVLRPCYKWGSGGWQSSCCTTNLSMYPLPAVPNKRHTRVGGRKMSGSAFTKLLSRLAGEGNDLSLPVDLREHWAKHGTNRYITIK